MTDEGLDRAVIERDRRGAVRAGAAAGAVLGACAVFLAAGPDVPVFFGGLLATVPGALLARRLGPTRVEHLLPGALVVACLTGAVGWSRDQLGTACAAPGVALALLAAAQLLGALVDLETVQRE